MHATTVAVDLAKSVFQIAMADDKWHVVEQQRLTRSQFERWFHNRDVGMVVMEACGSAHHWGRWLNGLGIEVKLLPAADIRAYVKRNKTDAADASFQSAPQVSRPPVPGEPGPGAVLTRTVIANDGQAYLLRAGPDPLITPRGPEPGPLSWLNIPPPMLWIGGLGGLLFSILFAWHLDRKSVV